MASGGVDSARRGPLGEDERTAIGASHLRSLPPEVIAELTADASRLRVPAGSMLHREGTTSPHLEIVVTGLVRVYITAPDGRTMTVRYCRPAALIGVVSLFASPFLLPATIQAVTDELSERVLSFIAEIPSAFTTVRRRVARHLLDLASESQRDSELVAAIGQQDLADAVGTVREVIVRALRELREDGLLRTGRQGIVLIDPEQLAVEAYGSQVGTQVTGHWNPGR